MADKAWKAFERRVATFFQTTRNPLSGRNSKHSASDSLHPSLFIECKMCQKFAHHVTLATAEASAMEEGKVPVLVTQQKFGKRFVLSLYADDLLTFCRKYLEGKGYKIIRARSKDE